MLPAVTQFADSSSGIGALGVSGSAFLIQLITFLLAYLVLRKWAFGPIMKVLNERRETIEAGVALGEKMRAEETKLAASVEKAMQEARAKADAVVADAQDAAREALRDGEAKAQAKADAIIADAKDKTKQEVSRARKQLETELVGLISDATEAIIDEKVDAKKDAALIDRALKSRSTA